MRAGVSLFVWLPEERAKWVEMRAKRDRAIRAIFGQMSADLDKAQAEGVELSTAATASKQWRYPIGARIGHKIC